MYWLLELLSLGLSLLSDAYHQKPRRWRGYRVPPDAPRPNKRSE